MKSLAALFFIVIVLVISGCETFHGLGKDVENFGKGVERTGEWVQEKAK